MSYYSVLILSPDFRIHDSRNELEKPTNKAPLGSYVSMLATRMAASEDCSVWDLARDVAGQAGEVLEKRKNFTDVAVLELLFNTVRGDVPLPAVCLRCIASRGGSRGLAVSKAAPSAGAMTQILLVLELLLNKLRIVVL